MEILQMINLKELPTLLPHNIDWPQIFHNDNDIDVEIGCGRPHFFFDRAYGFKDRNIVAMEWKYEFIKSAHARIVRDGLKNALAMHGNAWLLLPLLFGKKSISNVFINFPDPWWKERHKKRLLLNEIFLDCLKERIKGDGAILLQTDVEELFSHYCQLMSGHGGFKLDADMNDDVIKDWSQSQSHREKKCLEQGLPIFRALFRPT